MEKFAQSASQAAEGEQKMDKEAEACSSIKSASELCDAVVYVSQFDCTKASALTILGHFQLLRSIQSKNCDSTAM